MTKEVQGKPSYEPPTSVPLGELARPEGQSCRYGTNARGACHSGGTPGGSCKIGEGGNPPEPVPSGEVTGKDQISPASLFSAGNCG